ncbi:MAG: hypothetical protein IJ615_06565 [Bacteroidaceae bacterium]|nr:hypothetical protein [Bacteroidaceae bacterium]
MKHQHLSLTLVLMAVALPATAQVRETYGGDVEIVELYESLATFSSIGIDSDSKKVLTNAEKNLFQKLLYEGVEGFNDDKPLAERDSPVLEAFFHAKYQKELMGIKTGTKTVESSLPYQAYVVSSSLEEQPEKTGEGQYAAPALIVVNHAMLRKYLETNKVILGGDSVVIKENVKAGRPNFLERRRNNTQ